MSAPDPTSVGVCGVTCRIQGGIGITRRERFAGQLEQPGVVSVRQRQTLQARKEAAQLIASSAGQTRA